MEISAIKSIWPEKQGFTINRPDIGDGYIFIHFLSPVTAVIDGCSQAIHSGGCILYSKHSRQYFSADEAPLFHDWFHLSGDISAMLKKYGIIENTVYYPANDEFVTQIIQELEIEFMQKKLFFDNICNLRLEEMFAKIARFSSEKYSFPSSDSRDVFIKLRALVHLKFNEAWSTKRMAAEVKMSESRFYTVYKQIFGISPQKDLQNTRIEHAKKLLITSSEDIDAIAEHTGYSSSFHFIKQFKKICGITPGQYRHSI